MFAIGYNTDTEILDFSHDWVKHVLTHSDPCSIFLSDFDQTSAFDPLSLNKRKNKFKFLK